jgi:aquaporin TIP
MGFPSTGRRVRGGDAAAPRQGNDRRQDGSGLLVGPGNNGNNNSHKGGKPHKKKGKGSGGLTADEGGGLLVIQSGKLAGRLFLFALLMEFLGVMLFSLFGNSVTPAFAPAGNGLVLAVLIYITANISGGHLNPAVTFATMITGHISLVKGFLYWVAQISGGIIGTLLTVGLKPGLSVGVATTSCFAPAAGVSKAQAFGWETFSTFLLVATVYAVAIGKPSFGNVGPLAIGLSLWGAANCAGGYTGAALNPARALGPAAVFHCYGGSIWAFVLGEMLGGACAGLLSWPLYGTGPQFGKVAEPELMGGGSDDQDSPENEAEQGRNHEHREGGQSDNT